jgi:uncharacterized protein with ATP-grasp and redox domains
MKSEVECITCFYNAFMKQLAVLGFDEAFREAEAKAYLKIMAKNNFQKTPAEFGRYYWNRILEVSGRDDPLRREKDADNQRLLSNETAIYQRILASDDPVRTAMKLSIAGNVMDLMVDHGMKVVSTLENAIQTELAIDDLNKFVEALQNASNVLYLTDNAGEIVMDKLFIRLLLKNGLLDYNRFWVAVRGRPVINDATRKDAQDVGLTDMVQVIDNGDNAWGTSLAFCSQDFLRHFAQADLVIAKGMGNYETIGELQDKTICFLLIVKCNPVQRAIGVPRGSFVCQLKSAR